MLTLDSDQLLNFGENRNSVTAEMNEIDDADACQLLSGVRVSGNDDFRRIATQPEEWHQLSGNGKILRI